MTTNDPSRPRAVPAIRDELNTALLQAERGGGDTDVFRQLRWEAHNLAHGDTRLVWISEEMCQLVIDVAATLPDDLTLGDLPRPLRAMTILAHPVEASDAMAPDLAVRVNGIHWGPIIIGNPDTGETGTAIGSLVHSSGSEEYERVGEHLDDDIDPRGLSHDRHWWPIGRSEWMDNETIVDVSHAGHAAGDDEATVERYAQSAIEDRRLFAAIVSLMAQERFVEMGTWRPRSKSAKRRAGNSTVDTVTLRRAHTGDAGSADVGSRAGLDHRTWVAPYMRMQPYGPGRSLRRLQLVAGHVRGPDDAPFQQRTRVWALRH